MKGTGARALALEAVRRVVDDGAYSNVAIPSLLGRSSLDRRDRAFAAELAYGTLRRLPILDRAIAARANRTIERIGPNARHVLRLGAYQLLFLGTPPHAAVGETVDLAGPQERGFVNAVLRAIATQPTVEPEGSDDDAIAARTGLSVWAVDELRRLVGAQAEDAAVALASRAPLSIRLNPCVTDRAALTQALEDGGSAPLPGAIDPDCLTLDRVDPVDLPGFDDGWFAIQDQASAFVVRVLAPQPGDRIVDLCAAPGGKALAAACAVRPGGLVVAADVHPARTGLIARQARRLRVDPRVLVQDALASAIDGAFDRVLVDAPCSGIGSARRRPELLWRVSRDRLAHLASLQTAIALAGAALLRPGGRLVYSVCTFPRVETDAVVDELLAARPDLIPVTTDGPDGPAARHRLWPHRHRTDGMFVAAFEVAS